VKVVAVDRSKNESQPVTVFVEPLEPPVHTIGKTLSIEPSFGGLYASWKNPDRTEISVVLEKKDDFGDYVSVDIFYSSVVNGEFVARGMDTVPGDFRIYVQDRWENQSAPLDTTLTPMFEMKFDRMKFRALYLDGDEPTAWGWVLPSLFDGDTSTGFHTSDASPNCPQVISFDMGVKGKISRIKLWQRDENEYFYIHGNIRRFEIWGTNDGANFNDWSVWTKLAECESIKPSGLPLGSINDEDRAHALAGEEFPFPIDAPVCQYLRMLVYENWSGTCFFHVMEIEVYGSEEN
jgi:hypothetical protein